ncbi:MAG: hypothetical protein HYW05_01165 [Candidatus Diapherotrites archaeon]|nr:hypothetical protein [Candidatus Diapherotrites archaeon]
MGQGYYLYKGAGNEPREDRNEFTLLGKGEPRFGVSYGTGGQVIITLEENGWGASVLRKIYKIWDKEEIQKHTSEELMAHLKECSDIILSEDEIKEVKEYCNTIIPQLEKRIEEMESKGDFKTGYFDEAVFFLKGLKNLCEKALERNLKIRIS